MENNAGFTEDAVIPLFINGELEFIDGSTLSTVLSSPQPSDEAVVEDVRSLRIYSIGNKGISQVINVSHNPTCSTITIRTGSGRNITIGKDQEILVKTKNRTGFIPARELRPQDMIAEFNGILLEGRENVEIDLIQELISRAPAELLSRIHVSGVKPYLLSLGDAIEKIKNHEEYNFDDSGLPDELEIPTFYSLVQKYGLSEYDDVGIRLTSIDGRGGLHPILSIDNSWLELLGIFTRFGRYDDEELQPILVIEKEKSENSLKLILDLIGGPITLEPVENNSDKVIIHFGGPPEYLVFQYVFGIHKEILERSLPRFLTRGVSEDISRVLQAFRVEMSSNPTTATREMYVFPNGKMAQQAYYFIRSMGRTVTTIRREEQSQDVLLSCTTTESYEPHWEIITEMEERGESVLTYRIQTYRNRPYFAGYGFILRDRIEGK